LNKRGGVTAPWGTPALIGFSKENDITNITQDICVIENKKINLDNNSFVIVRIEIFYHNFIDMYNLHKLIIKIKPKVKLKFIEYWHVC